MCASQFLIIEYSYKKGTFVQRKGERSRKNEQKQNEQKINEEKRNVQIKSMSRKMYKCIIYKTLSVYNKKNKWRLKMQKVT